MSVRVVVAGVTGWTGSAVAQALIAHPEFQLVGAVARTSAGQDIGVALGVEPLGISVSGSVEEALSETVDVLVDYTTPEAVGEHVLAAIRSGASAVVGTSGLTAADYAEIERVALDAGVGVIAAGNFSLTAALAKHFAGIAAKHIPHWEIIDFAHATKPDAPSGTTRELAEYLGGIANNELGKPIEDTRGPREVRGASIGGAQVHSLRLPSYVVSFEAIFGLNHERLSIRHDSGSGAEPYVNGTLIAAKRATSTVGLVRGLDTLLFG